MSSPINQSLTIVLEKTDRAVFDKALGLVPRAANIRILSEGKAFDCEIGADISQDALAALLSAAKISADICMQPLSGRKKSLLICDMDSTLIGQECIDELADFAGVKDRVSAITEKAMRGEIGFDGALTERVGLLKDLPLSALQTCFEKRIRLNAGARTLAQTMKANGAKTVIVSGGFTFFTGRIAELAGFDAHQANTLIDDGAALTGEAGSPILGRQAKLDALNAYAEDLGGPASALAIGDGANDLAMITAAGLGIAYYAKPAVAAAAHCAIGCTDLTTALYFQGYSDAEFVE
ncbi:MAG: phosphoserine phosphatase SerB [Alphaproteobacteria bacterium]